MKNIQVKQLHVDAKIPTRSHDTDAGLDLYANESASIQTTGVISTGIAVLIPDGYVGLIWPRSGLSAKHGIDVLAGVVDAGYTGEIKVCLAYNRDVPDSYNVEKGDKIAQLLIQKIETPNPLVVDDFICTDTEFTQATMPKQRGDNGFGSTGK